MRINDKEVKSNGWFAYDDCHKIYILEDDEDKKIAKSLGYLILPNAMLKEIYNQSCELKFISNWKLNICYVNQGEDAIIEE